MLDPIGRQPRTGLLRQRDAVHDESSPCEPLALRLLNQVDSHLGLATSPSERTRMIRRLPDLAATRSDSIASVWNG